MRLLRCDLTNFKWVLESFPDNELPFYAILSHTWGEDQEEVNFKDVTERQGTWGPILESGIRKLAFCRKQVQKDGLVYFWVDTCCIDKSSSAELQESLNSMYRWYQNAARCYVYLSDVSVENSVEDEEEVWMQAFRRSRWFRRGWTLQELIAPSSVVFYSKEGKRLGDKKSLETVLHEITGIPRKALQGLDLSHFDMKDRMSWAARRQTKRPEDAAYCLQGICNVYLPYMYGWGGPMAMRQLEKEIQASHPVTSDPESAIKVGTVRWKDLLQLEDAQLEKLDSGLDEIVAWFLDEGQNQQQARTQRGKRDLTDMSLELEYQLSKLLNRIGIREYTNEDMKEYLKKQGNQWERFLAQDKSDKDRIMAWICNRWLVGNSKEESITGYDAGDTLYYLMVWRGKWDYGIT